MVKLFGFMIFIFIAATLVNASMDGNTALATTTLSADLGKTETIISVDSVSGFRAEDVVFIDKEAIHYDAVDVTNNTLGTLANPVMRGYGSSKKNSYASGFKVYSADADTVNKLIGFNATKSDSDAGTFEVVTGAIGSMTAAVPKMLLWDYSHLDNVGGQYVKYLMFWPLSAMMVMSIIGLFVATVTSIF